MSKVLVVDDESSIRQTLCAFLRNAGYEADSAQDARTAAQMCADGTYDIVVTDIIMPRMTGMDLLAELQKSAPTTQVIVMTGEPTVDTAIAAVQSGAHDYLVKPVSKFDVIRAVSHAEQTKQLCDEKQELELQKQAYQSELERQVEAKTKALSDAMQGIISLLANVVETRDPYTAGHQRRVGNLAAAIARRMGMPAQTVETIRICGYLHDVGKISVPIEILCKPGILSDLEMQLIREHSRNGWDMMRHVGLPPLFSEVIYQHHERCDGSGYPRGLKGDQILPEAKVIMVADVVEAMMSLRPYRSPLGIDRALEEIETYAGSGFDSEAAAACCVLFREEGYCLEDTERISYLFET